MLARGTDNGTTLNYLGSDNGRTKGDRTKGACQSTNRPHSPVKTAPFHPSEAPALHYGVWRLRLDCLPPCCLDPKGARRSQQEVSCPLPLPHFQFSILHSLSSLLAFPRTSPPHPA